MRKLFGDVFLVTAYCEPGPLPMLAFIFLIFSRTSGGAVEGLDISARNALSSAWGVAAPPEHPTIATAIKAITMNLIEWHPTCCSEAEDHRSGWSLLA
jgi:hypothetical protein